MNKKRAIILAEIFFLLIILPYFSTALSITINSPLNQAYNHGNISLEISVDLENTSCKYSLNNQSVISMLNSTSTLFSENIVITNESSNEVMFYCKNNFNDSISETSNNIAFSIDFCIPNWERFDRECKTNNERDIWFNDSNSCFQKTNLSSDNNRPANTTEYCDFCLPNWQPRDASCENGLKTKYYVDENNCYSKTSISSDNIPPSNTSVECDSCIPDWELANTSCENNEITQYSYDLNDCYKKTGDEEDRRGQGWESNLTFYHKCFEEQTIVIENSSENNSNAESTILDSSKLTGNVASGNFSEFLKNKSAVAGTIILFVSILVLGYIASGMIKKKSIRTFGFR